MSKFEIEMQKLNEYISRLGFENPKTIKQAWVVEHIEKEGMK